MTPKQREKIYRKAAKLIFNRENDYCCKSISVACRKETFEYTTPIRFPEIFMFNPNERLFIALLWWGNAEQSRNERILALLLSAEMTKTENL